MAWGSDIVDCIRAWESLDIAAIGVNLQQFEAAGFDRAIRELRSSGLIVSNVQGIPAFDAQAKGRLPDTWSQTLRCLDVAVELETDLIVLTTGARGPYDWDRAMTRVFEQAHALLGEAHDRSLRLAIEPVHPMRQDISFLTMATDAVEFVDRVDDPSFGYVFDTNHLWWQRSIEECAHASADRVFCVQISDQKAVTLRTQDRAMPGAGISPLPKIVRALADGGFDGWWELEVLSDDNRERGITATLEMARQGFSNLWT